MPLRARPGPAPDTSAPPRPEPGRRARVTSATPAAGLPSPELIEAVAGRIRATARDGADRLAADEASVRTDCPECRSAGAVVGLRCQICDAETTGEATPSLPGGSGPPDEAVDLPPTASSPLRFSQVVAELRRISELMTRDPGRAQEACRRAEEMLAALRAQVIGDVVIGRPASTPSRTGR